MSAARVGEHAIARIIRQHKDDIGLFILFGYHW